METSAKMDSKMLRIKPLIVKKGKIFLNHTLNNDTPYTKAGLLFKEDILYDTSDLYFLKGEYQRLLLLNRYNIVTKQSRAIAKYYSHDGSITEKNSDKVTEVIGHDQFKTIFTALCSILDQDLKIRSILALLTADKNMKEPGDIVIKEEKKSLKVYMDNSSQTDEMRIEKLKPKRRNRKPVGPYIVQDVDTGKNAMDKINTLEPEKKIVKKLLINVQEVNRVNADSLESFTLSSEVTKIPSKEVHESEQNSDPLINQSNLTSDHLDSHNSLINLNNQSTTDLILTDSDKNQNFADVERQKRISVDSLPVLQLHDDCSNGSFGSVWSKTSIMTSLLPETLLNNVNQHTQEKEYIAETGYRVPGTDIIVPYKPEDIFHIATKDNLQFLDNADKKKLMQHQLRIDYENCLTVIDEDGNLPIHLAVLNKDAELLVRQCIVLKLRGSSVDIPVDGATPLKLAVGTGEGALAASLLRHGACPLRTDDAHRACVHDAAEKDADVLRAVLAACRQNARKILYDNEGLWKPEMEKQSDEELAQYLLKYMCSMYNKQGYNPLMLASMLGLYENVRVLIEHSANVNDKMPTSGYTALYVAAAAAYNASMEAGNTSKVDDRFRKTIEILLQNGADPCIENNYGASVHSLLQEFGNYELSKIIANNHYLQLLKKKNSEERDIAKVMLVLGRDGEVQYKNIEDERKKKPVKITKDNELVIVENVVLKPGNTASEEKKVNKTTSDAKKVIKATSNAKKVIKATSDAKKVTKTEIKSRKLKVFQISNNPIASNVKVRVPLIKHHQAIKRKQSDAPKVIKQAKVDK